MLQKRTLAWKPEYKKNVVDSWIAEKFCFTPESSIIKASDQEMVAECILAA